MPKVNITIDQDKKAWKDNYNQAITDLQTAQTANLDTIGKLQTAVKGMAVIQEKTLKALKRLIK